MTTPLKTSGRPKAKPPKRSVHVAVSGDTASAIARRYNITLTQLVNLNGGKAVFNPALIRVGQEITVPLVAPHTDTPPAPPKVFRVLPPPGTVTSARFQARASTLGITVHCSATRPSQNFGAVDMDRMHRNIGWLTVGYHFIIRRDGTVEAGRPIHAVGSHCRDGNRNQTHASVCLIGGVSENPQKHIPGNPWNGSDAECNFTPAQLASLKDTISHIEKHYGRKLPVEGHRDVPGVRKACPSFVVSKWLKTGVASLN